MQPNRAPADPAAPSPFQAYLLQGLTDQQVESVTAPAGDSLLIQAGPGTGKTSVLIRRASWLATCGIPLERMLICTFTNNAAREIRDRIYRIFLGDDADDPEVRADVAMPTMGTFHGIAARLLRTHANDIDALLGIPITDRYTILNDEDQLKLIKESALELLPPGSHHHLDPEHAKGIQEALDAHACSDPDPDVLADNLDSEHDEPVIVQYRLKQSILNPITKPVSAVIRNYTACKRRNRLVDYNDLISLAVLALRRDPHLIPRYEAVLCDEYQDTNLLQEEFLQLLRGSHHAPLTCVGDDAQLLYTWRGAAIENILGLPDRIDCRVLSLTQNFRSPQPILDVANVTLQANVRQRKTVLQAHPRHVSPAPVVCHVFPHSAAEADWIVDDIRRHLDGGGKPGDCAVLARTQMVLNPIDHRLARLGIPYRVTAGRQFAQRGEIRDAAAWINLLVNPADNAACERALQRPRRGIGKASIEKLRDTAAARRSPMIHVIPNLVQRDAIKGSAARGATEAYKLFLELSELADQRPKPHRLLTVLLERTGLEAAIRQFIDSDDPDERQLAEERKERFDQLVELAHDHTTIIELAEHLAIADTSVDAPTGETVTLSTVHAAKGREWPRVHIPACEEGTLPTANDNLEEERRILYVAITRAQQRLTLSRCLRRREAPVEPSRFLTEIAATVTVDEHLDA